jgi:dynactin complex subunit
MTYDTMANSRFELNIPSPPFIVGNCDGSIKGHRYFTTDPQRGIFLKRFDVEAVV